MENLYEYHYSLAITLWGLMTINDKQEVKMSLINAVGDEVFITAFYAENGTNVRLEYFSNGLLLKEEVLDGGSYEDLEEFIYNALDLGAKAENPARIGGHAVMSFSDFTFETDGHKPEHMPRIYDFEYFQMDNEIDHILNEDPAVELPE
jgi:hypothetical protein